MASMPEADRRIAAAILRYLKRISERENVEDDSKESLDVASMCIQATFGVQPEEYQEVPPLEDLFGATGGGPSAGTPPAGMQDNLDKAEKLKNEGNVKLKESNYEAAISLYTSAIELAPSNAPYYSNRAAAYIKLEDFPKALSDCQEAVALNPNYARAHGRMGFIYTKLSQPHLAKEAFQKAVELEPDNAEYKSSLQQLEGGPPNPPPAAGGPNVPPPGMPFGFPPMPPDIGNLFSNPAFANMANTVMSNPAFQNMAMQFLQRGSGGGGPPPPPGGGSNPPGPGEPGGFNVQDMMSYLGNMRRQMEENDPEGFEELRQQAAQFKATHPDENKQKE